jgi:hypothetical protein
MRGVNRFPSHVFDKRQPRAFVVGLAVLTLFHLNAEPAFASSFTIVAPDTTARTLGPGSGETGTVTAAGSLTVSGGTVAVTISGNNGTLTNLGSITQSGNGRVIRDNTGVSGLMITNGSTTNSTASMTSADADVIQMNKSPASVTLNNYGKMASANASAGGAQVVDFNAIQSGTNVVNNFATGVMTATDADVVRPGAGGVVYNAGSMTSIIKTFSGANNGLGSDGVDGQNNNAIQVTNDSTGLIEGGRHGITGGAADSTVSYTMSVLNNLGGTIQGDNGSGINIDGFNGLQLVTIVNHGTIAGNGVTGDGDGVDVDGLVNLTNTGTIVSRNAFGSPSDPVAQSEGVTVGGGTIVNSGTIEGSVAAGNTHAVGRGITLAGNDITSGPLAGTREAIYGNAVVTNMTGGLIRGDSDSGIIVEGPASGFTVVINNQSGAAIVGGGAPGGNAAIRTGADNDTINNAGTIDGSSNHKAIDMGAGNNRLNITGGAIHGDIDGGAGGTNLMTVDLGLGHTFAVDGMISDFTSIEIKSGALKLGASNEIDNLTDLILNGGTFDLNDFSEGAAGTSGLGHLILSSTSVLDFGSWAGANQIQFGGVGAHATGAVLQILGFDFGLDHLYFLGTNPSAFSSVYQLNDVCFDGACGYKIFGFDGYYEVASSVPEPTTLSLVGLALIGLGLRRRRDKLEG